MNERRIEVIRQVVKYRQQDLVMVLENVDDDHNIGAVMRTCDAVGIQELVILNSRPDTRKKFIKVGKRTSAGTRKYINLSYFTDVNLCVDYLKEKELFLLGTGWGDNSVSMHAYDFTKPTALIVGNEKIGLSAELISHLDGLVTVPQFGTAQSLNVSVATAILLYESLNQRQRAGSFPPEWDEWHEMLFEKYLDKAKTKPDPTSTYKIFRPEIE
jgi:tRNA (guanosine-2'-O-)-methyltransferase